MDACPRGGESGVIERKANVVQLAGEKLPQGGKNCPPRRLQLENRQLGIVFSMIREMLCPHKDWGDICALTSRRQKICQGFPMPSGSNPKHSSQKMEGKSGGGGRRQMAPFLNGTIGMELSKSTTR
jgi:hypothetical protein